MLSRLFNAIFFIGRFIENIGSVFKNISIFLHIRFKTKTGIRIAAALEQTKQQLTQMKQELEAAAKGAENNENFRSFFVNNKPGNS